MRTRDTRESRPVVAKMVQIVPLKEEDVQPRWEKLSKELAEKKENLEELIRNTSVSFWFQLLNCDYDTYFIFLPAIVSK